MKELLQDFWNFAKKRKKLWLLPSIIILLLLGIIGISAGGSIISPFIYALF